MGKKRTAIKISDLGVREPGNYIQLCLGLIVGGLGTTGPLCPDLSNTEIGSDHFHLSSPFQF